MMRVQLLRFPVHEADHLRYRFLAVNFCSFFRVWHPGMRYDGHRGDGDSIVEPRPHPFVRHPGLQRLFFIFRPLCKDIGHEFRSSSGRVYHRYCPGSPLVWRCAEPRVQYASSWRSKVPRSMLREGWVSPDSLKTYSQ